MTQLSKLNQNDRVIKFLEANLKQIGEITYKTIHKEDQELYFDFVVLIYENYYPNRLIRKECMKFLILGLSSKDILTRNRFVEFLNSEDRLPNNLGDRIKFNLRDLYNPDYEQYWLTSSAHLLLSLCEKSRQCGKPIFDKPLEGYVDKGVLQIGKKGTRMNNLSQPLIPLSLINMSQDGMNLSQFGSQIYRGGSLAKSFSQM
jgi:hypothetical protein